MKFRIKRCGEVASTNDLIKEAISNDEAEGLVVIAESQTAGYGRRGNRWASAPGGLYMSLLLRPDKSVDELQPLGILTALAVRRAVASIVPDGDIVKIKWPNDVVVMRPGDTGAVFQKICGISTEHREGSVCVGIGVNVLPTGEEIPEGRNRPTFIKELDPSADISTIDELADKLLEAFDDVYEEWLNSDFSEFKDEFMDNFALEGFKIRIDETGDAEPLRCEVVGVSQEGHLQVVPEGFSDVRIIAAGTISVIN